MEPIPKPEIRSFAPPGLLPVGHLLVVNETLHTVTLLNLQQQSAPILAQCCLSSRAQAALLGLLTTYPHYCSHQHIQELLFQGKRPFKSLSRHDRIKRTKQHWARIEYLKTPLASLGLHIHLVPGQGYYIASTSPAAPAPLAPVAYFAPAGLLGAGQLLAVHAHLGLVTLLDPGLEHTQPITAQFRFSPSAAAALLCLLDTYPHCCLYQQVFERLYPADALDLPPPLVRRPVFRAMEQLDKGLAHFGLALYPARDQGYHLRRLSNPPAHTPGYATKRAVHTQGTERAQILPRLSQRFATR